jgi:hypothetical protein
MKKVPIEVMRRSGDQVTVILPEYLSHLELLGIAEQLLQRLGLPAVKIVIQAKEENSND